MDVVLAKLDEIEPITKVVVLAPLLLMGLFSLVKLGVGVLGFFWRHFVYSAGSPRRFGKWAVVTGATDGIGRAYAMELAKKQMNVLLISRTQSKLDEVAEAIKEQYKVDTQTLAVDFSTAGDEEYEAIAEAMKALEVGVLVNNVGASHKWPERLDQMSLEEVKHLISMNVTSTTRMCYAVLPQMMDRQKGAIVNMASVSGGYMPTPLLAEYSACKAYIDTFSRALNQEYAEHGIFVGSEKPYFVVSKLSGKKYTSFDTIKPQVYAKAAVRQLGLYASSSPYWSHEMIWNILTSLPTSYLLPQVLNTNKKVRQKAIAKHEKTMKEGKKDK